MGNEKKSQPKSTCKFIKTHSYCTWRNLQSVLKAFILFMWLELEANQTHPPEHHPAIKWKYFPNKSAIMQNLQEIAIQEQVFLHVHQ